MARRLSARQRRARVLVTATVLSLLALGVHSIASSGRDQKLRQLGYLDEVRPLIADSTAQGADLMGVRANANDLGQPGSRRRLQQVVKETRSTLEAMNDVDPPKTAEGAHSLLVATLQLRVLGAAGVAKGMIDALSAEGPAVVVDRLVASGKNIIAADQTYEAFREVVRTTLADGASESIAASDWTPDDDQWAAPELTALVNILKANSSLGPIVDVTTVLVRTNPTAVGKDGVKLILPRTGSVRLEVVVANIGNVAQKNVTVTATLQSATGIDTARDFVDLSPGQRRTLSFRGLRTSTGDAVLTVTIGPLTGETSTVDNTITDQLSVHT